MYTYQFKTGDNMLSSLKKKSKLLSCRITEDLSGSIADMAKRNDCSISAISAVALEVGLAKIIRLEGERGGVDLGEAIARDHLKAH